METRNRQPGNRSRPGLSGSLAPSSLKVGMNRAGSANVDRDRSRSGSKLHIRYFHELLARRGGTGSVGSAFMTSRRIASHSDCR